MKGTMASSSRQIGQVVVLWQPAKSISYRCRLRHCMDNVWRIEQSTQTEPIQGTPQQYPEHTLTNVTGPPAIQNPRRGI